MHKTLMSYEKTFPPQDLNPEPKIHNFCVSERENAVISLLDTYTVNAITIRKIVLKLVH